MELVVGESLATHIERERALSVARAVEIASCVCAGVGAAHAAASSTATSSPTTSCSGATVASSSPTPAYMAPEQVEAAAVIDLRADVYALGEILYEMLTGERAWPGESPFAVAAARMTQPPPDPRAKRPDVEPRLAEVALRCMAKSPGDRFPSMQDVASALARITLPKVATVPPARPDAPVLPKDAPGAHKRVAVLQALEAADAASLYDLAWFDRCPSLAPLRDLARFRALREPVAARAARARAAYAAGV